MHFQFSYQEDQYLVLNEKQVVASVKPGAFLNHYCVILDIHGTAIGYSVCSTKPDIDPSSLISDFLKELKQSKVKYSVIATGLVTATVVGASAFLNVGGIAIAGLWLHPIKSGFEIVGNDQSSASYYYAPLHSKLNDLNQSLIANDVMALRHVFAKVLKEASRS